MSDAGRERAAAAVDTAVPSVARIYDYAVGGKDNFETDRDATHDMMNGAPEMVRVAKENRAFLGRAVRYLAGELGVRQFIDNGSGLPTAHNVHQVAQEINPESRVVYVDNDPAVLAYGRALLAENGNTAVMQADMAKPQEILAAERTQELIDFSQPVAVLYVSVLHCLPDSARPGEMVSAMLDAVPSGSYLLLSHIVSDDEQSANYLTDFMTSRTDWGRVRTPAEASRYFDGLERIEPGLVDVAQWRADDAGASALEDFGSTVGENDGSPEKKLWELGGLCRKPREFREYLWRCA